MINFWTNSRLHGQPIMSSLPTKMRVIDQAWPKPQGYANDQRYNVITPVLLHIIGALLTLASLGLAFLFARHPASKLALHHHITFFTSTGWVLCSSYNPTRPSCAYHITLLTVIPRDVPRWLGARTAKWRDRVLGPVVTQIRISMPIIGLSAVLARPRVNHLHGVCLTRSNSARQP